MKTRLFIFIASLLLFPPVGFLLSGREWDELAALETRTPDDLTATALTLLAVLGYTLLVNLLVKLRTGNNPLMMQRNYFLTMSAASAATGWLLVYLSRFGADWNTTSGGLADMLLGTLLFALLAPTALGTRALIGSFPRLLKTLARGLPLPIPADETGARTLTAFAALGLLGSAALPTQQYWLIWAAPLLLLFALQLYWHEATILHGLKNGDWGRLVCAILAGLIVGNLTILIYRTAGGSPSPVLLAQSGYVLFGLLSLQLGDVIAEHWRGIQRTVPVQPRKKFPIPVVVKKN